MMDDQGDDGDDAWVVGGGWKFMDAAGGGIGTDWHVPTCLNGRLQNGL